MTGSRQPKAPWRQQPPWLSLYLLLAVFVVGTLAAGGWLNHRLLRTHRHSLAVNLEWVNHLKAADEMARQVSAVVQPVNGVLQSRDPAVAAAQFHAALELFAGTLEGQIQELQVHREGEERRMLTRAGREVETQMAVVVKVANQVFDAVRNGEPARAAERMPALSREYDKVLAALNELRAHYRQRRQAFMDAQLVDAAGLGRWDGVMIGLALISLVGFALHGVRLSRQILATEAQMRASETKYRSLVETTQTGYLILDAEGKVVDANSEYVRLTGRRDVRDIHGRSVREWTAEYEKERNAMAVAQCARDGFIRDLVIDYVDAAGQITPVEINATVINDGEGVRILSLCRDVTQRQQAEAEVAAKNKELAESREFVQATMDSLQAHVCVVAEHGSLLAVNQAWRDFAAANPPINGKIGVGADYLAVCDAVTGPDAKIAHAFATGIRGVMAGTRDRFESEYPCHSPQQQRWFVGRVTRLIGETTRRVVVAHENITERVQAEAAVQAKNKELEQFTYSVSHDLRSPLVTIQTFLGHLEQDIAAQNATRVATDLGFIRAAASKMAQMLDELLSLSRLGRQANPPVAVPLQDLVQEVLALVAGRIAQRGVQVSVMPEPVTLHGDRPRLVEVFQNLIDNACKFMGDQQDPRIEVGVETRGAEPLFFVRDNGSGIEPGQQGKVFGLFVRLQPHVEGTGLGLTLVKRIIEVHGGRIWVESKGAGQGACFYFTLAGAVDTTELHG